MRNALLSAVARLDLLGGGGGGGKRGGGGGGGGGGAQSGAPKGRAARVVRGYAPPEDFKI